MRKDTGWWYIIGFFGLLATAADAQTPSSSTAGTKFDGTYAFVSSVKVKDTYMTRGTMHIKQCGDLKPRGPLTVVNGRARYNQQEGTVGPQGELEMRLTTPAPGRRSSSPGVEVITRGNIDSSGTVHARRIGYNCSYDLTWQKDAR